MRKFVGILLLLSIHAPLLAQTAPNDAAQAVGELTLWELVLSAEWVLIPMGLLSFLVMGVILFNFFLLRKKNIADDAFLSKARVLLENGDLVTLLDWCEQHPQTSARVLARTISFARANPELDLDAIQQIAEADGNQQTAKLNQPTQLLMDLGVMAPMVGLLGTVVGILRSFGTIASDATPMRTILLAGGVSQALIATALGLVVGLLAMFFYAYFRARVQNLATYFEGILTELLVKTYYRLGEDQNNSSR